MSKMEDLFEKYNDNEYLKFDRVENKRSNRPDLHAFLLLDELFPGIYDIITDAEHDGLYLCFDHDEIETLSEDNVIELVRCGVMYDGDRLSLFT